MDMEFITVVKSEKGGDNKIAEESLLEGEKDPQRYDYFVREIRRIFGIAYEDSLGLQQLQQSLSVESK